jgi:hypothetical protein
VDFGVVYCRLGLLRRGWLRRIGAIAFMVSGIFALVLPNATEVLDLRAANLWTFIGAVGFLIGAYLLLPEMAKHRSLEVAQQH